MNSLLFGHTAGLAIAFVAQIMVTGNYAVLDRRFALAAVVGGLLLLLLFSWAREFAGFTRGIEAISARSPKRAAFTIGVLGGSISYALVWIAGFFSGYATVTVLVLSPLVSVLVLKALAKWRNRPATR